MLVYKCIYWGLWVKYEPLDCTSHTAKLTVNLLRQRHQVTNFYWKHMVLIKFRVWLRDTQDFVFSTYHPASGISAWTKDVKVISIINNTGVVSNFKWKVEYLYKNRILNLHSVIHKSAASAIHLWTITTKVILVIPVSNQISLIS